MTHEAIFKPSNPNKKGPMGTINKFPKYMEQKPKQILRKREEEGAPKKEVFKHATL